MLYLIFFTLCSGIMLAFYSYLSLYLVTTKLASESLAIISPCVAVYKWNPNETDYLLLSYNNNHVLPSF